MFFAKKETQKHAAIVFTSHFLVALFYLLPPYPSFCAQLIDQSGETAVSSSLSANIPYQGKKILWVSSYHRGYEANDDLERGIKAELQNSGVILHSFFMDTKRNDFHKFAEDAAVDVLAEIEEFKPDVIIASDDNAQRYLVEPYLKNGPVPVVFCGVNWDASKYGYPAANITGMVEVDLTLEMYHLMERQAQGERIGYLSGNVDVERGIVKIYNERFFSHHMKSYLVDSMSEFKSAFLRAQQENDMLYFYNYTGIKDWDPVEAELFISHNIKIPLGSHNGFMSRFVIFVVAKSLEEHGRYAAKTALRILDGVSPQQIPVTENKQAELYVNLRLAKAASMVLPVSLLKTATILGRMEAYLDPAPGSLVPGKYRGRKVIWVDSYHQGYHWSDGIERGLRNMFYDTGVDFEIVRMNTLQKNGEEYNRQAAQQAYEKIRSFQPDLIIASDDNAQQYLVVPYLLGKEIPVVFCGVNRSLADYGYPAPHITGMLEIQPVMELQKYLQRYAKGSRVGFLSGDVPIQRELAKQYNENFYNTTLHTYFVKSMKDFKAKFLVAQNEVDMLIFANYFGIDDWDADQAYDFITENNSIPTGAYVEHMQPFVVFSVGKISEEHGYFAAKAALRIFDGEKPEDIDIETNRLSRLMINLELANAAKLVLPFRLLRSAEVVGKRHPTKVK